MAAYQLTEVELRELIHKLGLPKIVTDIYDENVSDDVFEEALGYEYSKPLSILDLSAEEQKTYRVDRFKPILELRSSDIIAYDTERKGFIGYGLEEEIEDPIVLNWDGVFLEEVVFWYESEFDEDSIMHLAELLNLKYAEEIIESLDEAGDNDELSTFEDQDVWMANMINKLNMRVQ